MINKIIFHKTNKCLGNLWFLKVAIVNYILVKGICFISADRYSYFKNSLCNGHIDSTMLTLSAPTPQNGQTHSKNSSAISVFYHYMGFALDGLMLIKLIYQHNCYLEHPVPQRDKKLLAFDITSFALFWVKPFSIGSSWHKFPFQQILNRGKIILKD